MQQNDDLRSTVRAKLGQGIIRISPLTGGCVGDVSLIELEDGSRIVSKSNLKSRSRAGSLDIEGEMLRRLALTRVVPVPRVLHAEPDLLLLEYIPNDKRRSLEGEARLAELVAGLHGVCADRFGFEIATLIGGLRQINTESDSWARFFADSRLIDMGQRAESQGALPPGVLSRILRLADSLESELGELAHTGSAGSPVLIHGDLWSGNVLWRAGDPIALIDPAVYGADPEVELAFIDLMGGVGRSFWDRYHQLRSIRPGFWERRRDIYVLYPLLVHAVLFGIGYGSEAAKTLSKLGY